jgi:hypothetical protein
VSRRGRRLGWLAGAAAVAAAGGAVALAHPAGTSQPVILPPVTAAPAPPPATTPPAAAPASPAPRAASPPALRPAHDPGTVTGTIAGPCRVRGTVPGQLPDPRCTPGSYDPAVTAAVLCAPGYRTGTYRPPSSDTGRFKYEQAYPAYGIPRGEATELDHLVSLELGGSNDASNLWPEAPGVPNPKDHVESALHNWVCSATGAQAQRRLRAAQRAIASGWLTAERSLGIKGATP